MQRFGIDTSSWQGNFNFERAKYDEGVEFAILKIGGADVGFYKDIQFEDSYEKCRKCGLPTGAYYFGHAMSVDGAREEAAHFIELLSGKQFLYPVFYDVEGYMLYIGRERLTSVIKTVCAAVQSAGYWVGIYGAADNIQYYADASKLLAYSQWLAKYSKKPVMEGNAQLQMWQFGGGAVNIFRSPYINGIPVDQNYCYVDYPTLIRQRGLNGYKREDYKTYTVKEGDSLWGIAQRLLGNGMRYKEIMDLSGITSTTIYPGQILKYKI